MFSRFVFSNFFFFFFAQVKRTFNMDIQQFHNKWKNVSVEWLQLSAYMPKELDVPLCACYMNGLKFPAILHPVNVGLQHVAVGLEQVAWDQGREHLPFAKYFKETTSKLKLVSAIILCSSLRKNN